MRKIGIMGGTFNPIHMGHLLLAQWALDEVKLDEVWVMPTGVSYLKAGRDVTAPEDRYHMACLAVQNNEKFRCCDMEIKREGYTYSYETMIELHDRYPQDHFYFIFGADCLFSIENWKCPEQIFANCTVLAAVRGDMDTEAMQSKIEELKQKYHADIMLLPFMQLEISSTDIRERINMGKSVRYLVPDDVIAYIEEKGLYQNEVK